MGDYKSTFPEQSLYSLYYLIVYYLIIIGFYRVIARRKEDKSINTIDSPVRRIDKVLSISLWVILMFVMFTYPSKIKMKNSNTSYGIEQSDDDEWENTESISFEEWKRREEQKNK
jgi:uncharacterized membrane protein